MDRIEMVEVDGYPIAIYHPEGVDPFKLDAETISSSEQIAVVPDQGGHWLTGEDALAHARATWRRVVELEPGHSTKEVVRVGVSPLSAEVTDLALRHPDRIGLWVPSNSHWEVREDPRLDLYLCAMEERVAFWMGRNVSELRYRAFRDVVGWRRFWLPEDRSHCMHNIAVVESRPTILRITRANGWECRTGDRAPHGLPALAYTRGVLDIATA